MHRGLSDTVADANANSDVSEDSLANFGHQISREKLRILALRRNSLANANGLLAEIRLANGVLNQERKRHININLFGR